MFSRKKSPVKKKFDTAAASKKRRRQIDPRTRFILKQVLIGSILLILFALCGTGLWYGTRIEALTIRTVEAKGGQTIDTAFVESEVQRVLEGEYIGFVPRRFAWTYPEDEVLEVLRQIPRVKDPEVIRTDRTTLQVSFSEYLPHALWCESKDSEHCLFIDEVGFAFTEAPKLTGGAFPRFHTIGTTPEVGVSMLAVDDLFAIELLREAVTTELRLPVAYVETDMMRDVFMGVAGGGEIKATLRLPPEETIENLRSILASPEFADIRPGSFQYIDLRFGNKVFINEEDPSLATTSSSTLPLPVEGYEASTTVEE